MRLQKARWRQELATTLKKELAGCKKVVILGVGSEFHEEDSLGLLAAREISGLISSRYDQAHTTKKRFQVFYAGTTPENLTGVVRKASPSHVLIIDAAEMGREPGFTRIIERNEIDNITFSSHHMRLSILADYLEQEVGCRVVIIGIQPKRVSHGEGVSTPAGRLIRDTAGIIFAELSASIQSER